MINAGALVLSDGQIEWVGAEQELPAQYAGIAAEDLAGRPVTPGLIDFHTHVVFGGDRAP